MKPVNILGDDAKRFSFCFTGSDESMYLIGLRIEIEHPFFVEAEKLLGILLKERVGYDFFRRIFVRLIVKTVRGAKIRDAAVRGNACAREKDNVLCLIDDSLQRSDFFSKILCYDLPPSTL